MTVTQAGAAGRGGQPRQVKDLVRWSSSTPTVASTVTGAPGAQNPDPADRSSQAGTGVPSTHQRIGVLGWEMWQK